MPFFEENNWVILTPFLHIYILGHIFYVELHRCLNRAIEICWPHVPHWPYYDLLGLCLKSVTSFSFLSYAQAQAYTINFDECITHKTHFTNADSESVK